MRGDNSRSNASGDAMVDNRPDRVVGFAPMRSYFAAALCCCPVVFNGEESVLRA